MTSCIDQIIEGELCKQVSQKLVTIFTYPINVMVHVPNKNNAVVKVLFVYLVFLFVCLFFCNNKSLS